MAEFYSIPPGGPLSANNRGRAPQPFRGLCRVLQVWIFRPGIAQPSTARIRLPKQLPVPQGWSKRSSQASESPLGTGDGIAGGLSYFNCRIRSSRNCRSGSCWVSAGAFSYEDRASAVLPILRYISARAECTRE